MILVTGATGSNGLELIKLLATRHVPVRAMVRSTNRAQAIAALKGVELVVCESARVSMPIGTMSF